MSDMVSQQRTRNYISQIKGSVVFKGLAVAASFFTIPLMIRYLGQEIFGVWSTLLSIMSWVVFFDLGIGNGLRNKLAESLAKNQTLEAARFISSSYSLIGLISFILFAIMATATFFIPWQQVFNTQVVTETTLRYTVLIATFFICLNFWISLINQVLNAVQKTSLVVFGQLISNVMALAFVVILTEGTLNKLISQFYIFYKSNADEGWKEIARSFLSFPEISDASLLYLVTLYGLSLVISNVLLSFWFYRRHRELLPKPSWDGSHCRPLLSLGLQFFTIQVAALVIFTTDKMLITQLFGPQSVTQYDVVFKLFSIITLVHSLITVPLWSSYTDAYHRQDFVWIKQILHKQLMIFGIVVLAVIALGLMAKPIIKLWIGADLEVSVPLVISIGVFILVSSWNNIFGFVLGGIGKIRLGSFYTIITAGLNIPVCYFFAIKLDLGVPGIVWGTVVSIFISAFISPLQVYYFIYIKNDNKFLSRALR